MLGVADLDKPCWLLLSIGFIVESGCKGSGNGGVGILNDELDVVGKGYFSSRGESKRLTDVTAEYPLPSPTPKPAFSRVSKNLASVIFKSKLELDRLLGGDFGVD